MTNRLSFTDTEVQVEDYTFLVTRAYKTSASEQFYLKIKNGCICLLESYDDDFKLALFAYGSFLKSDQSLIYALDERKDFLIKLYNAIRNHPSIRLKLLNSLGPIKQY